MGVSYDKDCPITGFALPVAQFPKEPVPRKAPVYSVSAKSAKDPEGRPFVYFVATERKKLLDIESLPSELFSTDLQKCNTADTDSLLAFSGKFGFLPSPLFDGAASLLRFRNRRSSCHYSCPQIERLKNEADNTALSMMLNSPESLSRSLGWKLRGSMPRLLTEHARVLEAEHVSVNEVISEAEMAQAIRAIQCATALSSLYDFMAQRDTHGTACELTERLKDPAQLNQNGVGYFLHRDDLVVRGYRLASFEERIENDPPFAQMVSETECDARAGYNIALANSYRHNAQLALDYLSISDRIYRSAECIPKTNIDTPVDEFAAVLSSEKMMPEHGSDLGTLGEIITAQFARCFTSETPWRQCANCERIFKKYREEGFKKNIRETKFCKKSCNVMYIQRQKRQQS